MQRNDIVKINLNEPLLRSNAGEILATDDRQGNRFGALLHRDGKAVDASGYAVTGYFIRPNGDTVINEGTAQGNLVYVDLAPECYAHEGVFSLAIKVNGPSITSTIRVIDGYVRLTKTDRQIAPEGLLPDLEELLGQIAAMENAYTKGAHAMIARLSTPFTMTGETVSCYPVPDYPLDVITHFVPVQEGEGDASPDNIRALSPVNRVYLNCGKVAYHERTLNPNVYGGAYHWAEGKITGKAKYRELDGTEGWFLNPNGDTSYFLMYLEEGAFGVDHKAFMSHYKPLDTLAFGVAGTNVFRCWNKDGRFRLAIRPDLSTYATAEDFKAYLAAQKAAGTPVQLVYFVMNGAEEETGYQPEEIISRAGKNQFDSGLNGNTVTVSGPLDPAYQNAMQDERISDLEEGAIGGGGGYTLPIASAETLGGVKVGDGLEVNEAGVVSTALAGLSGMRKIAQITVKEETTGFTVDLGKLCKACRFIFVFPEKITAAGYVYATVGSVETLTQNMSGCNVNDVKVMEYIRIAADYRPITFFSTTPMEGNEMAQIIKFGFPYQQYCTYDEKNGFRYVRFTSYQMSFPVDTVITILGA